MQVYSATYGAGAVQVTQSTRELISAGQAAAACGFDLLERGEVAVKGAAQPLRMYLAQPGHLDPASSSCSSD